MGIGSALKLKCCLGNNSTDHHDDSNIMSSPGANATGHDDSSIMASPRANTAGHDDSGIMASPGANVTVHDDPRIVASPGGNATCYDVFLSFRGEDTRHSFTDHLNNALKRGGICTFMDDEEIEKGQELKPEIERAIKASKASIVVLSKNYATSTWCLDELWLILEQRRECNRFVLPIFYHVDPSVVRNQNNSFRIEVRPNSRWTDHNVNRWKAALVEVANLKGETLSGSETQFLKNIVDTIYNKLACKIVKLPPNLVGMNARTKYINSWLQSDVNFLVICGMGGSGKTTLANYIVSSNCQHFEIVSIVEDIGGEFEKQGNLNKLYEKFCHDMLGWNKEYRSRWMNHGKLSDVLKTKKTLIVFDDVDDPNHLKHFLDDHMKAINEQSKIIITTRKDNIHGWFPSRCWRWCVYEMQLLDADESLELLSLQAFRSKIPMDGYNELAKEALQYCQGNPLALEVLASFLSEGNSVKFWRSTLDLLSKDFSPRIQRVLIRSYNSLPHNTYKELFLHIACFFVGKDKDYVEKILEHDYFASSGIIALTNRRLLSVSPNNELMMHRLLQEMGRNIIRQESKHPIERSRSWCSNESYKILRRGEGSKTMLGLALDRQLLDKSSGLKTDSLRKMDNLKLLHLHHVYLTGSYENFSDDLRWLCWHGFHLNAMPSDLFNVNLVAIDMRDSQLEVFEPPTVLQSLKILNLGGSKILSEIHNISRLHNLETLILNGCSQLHHVCESIGGLMNLDLLDMVGCDKFFKNLGKTASSVRLNPSTSCRGSTEEASFSLPRSLVRLVLRSCSLECTEYFHLSFSVQLNLQYLDLGGGWFECLPSYTHLRKLRVLDLSLCSRLKWLLCLPCTLAELYIYSCSSLQRITFESRRFTLQEFGYEGCSKLSEIEGFIKLVPVAELDETDLGHLTWLKKYQNHKVCLFGDDRFGLTDKRQDVQMLYEFGIMSTSLPSTEEPYMRPEYKSESSSVSFVVPPCPKNKRLKGLNVSFKHIFTMSPGMSDMDGVWFAKISTTNSVDLMYNPMVYGMPEFEKESVTWLSYWPIGNTLHVGDEVNVSIIVIWGLNVYECGASLVYTDDDVADKTLGNNGQWVETLGGDLSAFQLSTGAYYLCRRDFYKLMQVGRLTAAWLSILFGDTIDNTEVRGWSKTGRPRELTPFRELPEQIITRQSDRSKESTSSSTELKRL